ncbi:hypothetical protein HanIR_Chr04g0185301 [Helianthus annuus]|nr:hypothetical protein HanIR_Chr04g0185301 [Helianthus annuus]
MLRIFVLHVVIMSLVYCRNVCLSIVLFVWLNLLSSIEVCTSCVSVLSESCIAGVFVRRLLLALSKSLFDQFMSMINGYRIL